MRGWELRHGGDATYRRRLTKVGAGYNSRCHVASLERLSNYRLQPRNESERVSSPLPRPHPTDSLFPELCNKIGDTSSLSGEVRRRPDNLLDTSKVN